MTYQKPELLQREAAISAIQASLDKGQDVNDNIHDPTSRSLDLYRSDE
jgi:hypothetical protein